MPTDDVDLAIAERDWPRAAFGLREAIGRLSPDAMPADRGGLLVRLADAERRAGRPRAAWLACREAAGIARLTGDGRLLADAALAAPQAGAGGWDVAAEQHALGREAVSLLGDGDDDRRARLAALLATTIDVWSDERPARGPAAGASRDARAAALRAEHDRLLHIRHAEERLALADALAALGGDDQLAEAALWQADAAAQLGRRVDLDAALMRLLHVVRRLREPAWEWRLTTAHASLALLDSDVAWATALAARAVEVAGEDAGPEVAYVDLVLRSQIAMRTGEDLEGIERELAALLRGAPFFAQGWRAAVLLAAGRRDEALAIWRVLAPRVTDLPEAPVEWLIAVNSFAMLALAARDRNAAAYLYDVLVPLDGRYVAVDAVTPSSGPVSMRLGELAALTGDRAAARRHLVAAIREAEAMHDGYHAALAGSSLRDLRDEPAPLSQRELEIARLVADGATNRSIAGALHLSERTVENHVSHVFAKLGVASRAAVAAWVVRREADAAR